MKILLIVLLVVVALLLLIGCIRVGGVLEYAEEGVLVQLRIGPVNIPIFPPKRKKGEGKEGRQKRPGKKKTKEDRKPKGEKEPPRRKRGGRLAQLQTWLPLGIEALGKLKRYVRIDELFLDYTISGRSDPARAAILYGRLCAGGGAVAELLERHFDVRSRRFSARVDFMAEHALVYAKLSLSFTIGQLVYMALSLGWKAVGIYRNANQNRKQEVANDGK